MPTCIQDATHIFWGVLSTTRKKQCNTEIASLIMRKNKIKRPNIEGNKNHAFRFSRPLHDAVQCSAVQCGAVRCVLHHFSRFSTSACSACFAEFQPNDAVRFQQHKASRARTMISTISSYTYVKTTFVYFFSYNPPSLGNATPTT